MLYLFIETFIWIFIAFVLGLLIGWWLCGRCKCKGADKTAVNTTVSRPAQVQATSTTAKAATTAASATTTAAAASDGGEVSVSDDWKPQGFTSRPSDSDELKRIKGIGPVIEKTLNGLGVYQFKQIAAFSSDNISWVENYLSFPGRIEREEWIPQAKALAEGKETEFSKRVDKGDLNY